MLSVVQKSEGSTSMHKVKLSKEGRAYINLYMKPYSGTILGRLVFKLDTGADLTTISKKELQVLGYTTEWIAENAVKEDNRMLISAGGKSMSAHYVNIPISNVFGKDLINWPFYILIDKDRDFPNLLGINVLSHFNFMFSYDTGYLEINPATAPIVKLPMNDGQEICEYTATDDK